MRIRPVSYTHLKSDLIVPLLTSEYDWAQTAWEDYADAYGVASGDEFFAMLYATEDGYSVDLSLIHIWVQGMGSCGCHYSGACSRCDFYL